MATLSAALLSSYDLNGQDICNACERTAPRPVLICFECSEGVDRNGFSCVTKYCSTKCRGADEREHAKHCKDQNVRKAIYRAGDLLRLFFLRFRQITFDMNVWKIEKKHGITYFHDKARSHEECPIYHVPKHLVQEGPDMDALLSFSACNEAPMLLQNILKSLLRDITTSIEDAVIRIDTKHCTIRRIDDSGDLVEHEEAHQIIGIDGQDGHSYIIDVAGAQYGQFKPVLPLILYFHHNEAQITRMFQHGLARGYQVKYIERRLHDPQSTDDIRCFIIQNHVCKSFDGAVKSWEDSQHQTLGQLLTGDRKSYEAGKESVLTETWEAMGQTILNMAITNMSWKDATECLGEVDQKLLDAGEVRPLLSYDPQGSGLYKTFVAHEIADVQACDPKYWREKIEPKLIDGRGVQLI